MTRPDPWPARENLTYRRRNLRWLRALMRVAMLGHGAQAAGFALIDSDAAYVSGACCVVAALYAIHCTDELARDTKKGGMRETR